MRFVAFLDLDDTIFQTLAKCPVGEPVRPVAYRQDGTPLSYMTQRQQALVDWLLASATVVPTTARNLAAFRRVHLPFTSFAILDFGGVVLLPGARPDPAWDAIVRPQAFEIAAELNVACATLQRWNAELHLGLSVRVISDFEMPLYLVAKHPGGDADRLEPVRRRLADSFDRDRFFLHSNGNNLSLVPRFLGKERAVRYLLDRHFRTEPIVTLGVGDSLTDAAFLDLCDFRMLPRSCQLTEARDGSSKATR
ncbi:MAG: hypothetical protein NZO58_09715 [Gemmataceae bacterium]|nr:hypothetical protein [Gemmataceae bacterium]